MAVSELEKWLLAVTGEEDLEQAKGVVTHALEIRQAFPKIGMVSMLVGPEGLLGVMNTQNLGSAEGLDSITQAALDLQRNLLVAQKRLKEQEGAGAPNTHR